MKPLTAAIALLALSPSASANTEKVIFTGPAPVNIPLAKPSLSDLNLFALGPDVTPSVRTNLSRVFPPSAGSADDDGLRARGEPAWLLLDNLVEGQRYELRVCWSAVEPTSFTLDVYPLDTVWETPTLIQSLAAYAAARQPASPPNGDDDDGKKTPQEHNPPVTTSKPHSPSERKASVLLLHVQAAADYYTDDAALMTNPPPVLVDLILDPYVFNALPRSLVPTVGYVVFLAVASWFVGRWSAKRLVSIATPAAGDDGFDARGAKLKKQN